MCIPDKEGNVLTLPFTVVAFTTSIFTHSLSFTHTQAIHVSQTMKKVIDIEAYVAHVEKLPYLAGRK